MKRWLIGFLVVVVAAVVVGGVALGFAVYRVFSPAAPDIESRSVLRITIDGPIAEYSARSGPFVSGDITLHGFTRVLRMAAADDRVDAVRLDIGNTGGFAKAQEMRAAISELRGSGVPVVAYIEDAGNLGYYVASACDRVFVNPVGFIWLVGLSSEPMFFAGTLDKLGIEVEFERIEEYKSAPEMLTRTSLSEPARRQLEDLLDDLYYDLVDGIATSRDLDGETVESIIDGGPYTSEDALSAGLVDELAYSDEVDAYFDELLGDGWTELDYSDYAEQDEREVVGEGRRTVAIVYAVGSIASGENDDDPLLGRVLGSRLFSDMIEQIAEDDDVDAVVLRVDSPGGSGLASDVIWRSLDVLDVPVVVSMGDVAASGGYYISVGGDKIVAQPGTITGSIGVFAGKFITRELQNDIGVNRQILDRGEHASAWSSYRRFTDEEREQLREEILEFYTGFLAKVGIARDMTPDEVHEVARGRVWSGTRALEVGLVDRLGGLEEAVRTAKEEIGVSTAEIVNRVVYPKPRSWLKELFEGSSGPAFYTTSPREQVVQTLQRFERVRVFALMPWTPNIR